MAAHRACQTAIDPFILAAFSGSAKLLEDVIRYL